MKWIWLLLVLDQQVFCSANRWRLETCGRHGSDGMVNLPSGKHTNNYGKSPFFMGKLTISMAIFNSKLLVYQAGYRYKLQSFSYTRSNLNLVIPTLVGFLKRPTNIWWGNRVHTYAYIYICIICVYIYIYTVDWSYPNSPYQLGDSYNARSLPQFWLTPRSIESLL